VSATAEPDRAVPPPTVETLEALPSDAWAVLLRSVRTGLQALDDRDLTPAIRRLRAAPTGRLAGGRVRRELCELLARGGPPWRAVLAQLREHDDQLPPAVDAIVRGEQAAPPPPVAGSTSSLERARAEAEQARAEAGRARAEADRARDRLREVRDERDAARRRAEGAEGRAAAAEAELAALRAEVGSLEAARTRLLDDLAAAEADRRRAVEREARRQTAEVERLRAELAALRRAEEEQRLVEQRRVEARQQARREAARAQSEARREAQADRGTKVRPGRPSVLPAGIAPDTTEAADALLHAGRLVLVDGYNLTLQHRSDLALEAQRTWLTQLLSNLAARRRVRPVVVFDGEQAGGGRPRTGSREVEVRFTPSGITADDELVLAVEATDEPVVVVTDDRELRARLLASGADVIGTAPFLWAAG
jgi:predicted RNA-binding protein with PIN domain